MKRLNLILLFFVASISAIAQINFTQILPPSPAPQIIPAFVSADQGSIAYADVDGINGLDVIITGSNSDDDPIAQLYINDGNGNYTEKTGTPFTGVTESSVAFADVDGNGSQDVIISGFDGTSPTSTLYLNDGIGNFTASSVTLEGTRESDIAFADVDGINGPDVLITGRDGAGILIARLYLNNGSGDFTNKAVTLGRVNKGAVAFADVDGDGSQDVVITGFNVPISSPGATPTPIAKIYINNGDADFTELAGTNFEGVRDSDVAFADVNNDNTPDLLISGFNSSGAPVTNLYTNDGNANFTEDTGFSVAALGFSAVAISNVDGANGPDILITGSQNSGNSPVSKLYINDGSGNFTEVSGTPFTNVSRGAIAFLDVDGDNIKELIISGRNSTNNPINQIFANDGTGTFSLATGTPFEGVNKSASAFADVDANGTQDAIVTGDDNANNGISRLYSNDGTGNFTEVSSTVFAGAESSAAAFADVDGSNGPDLLISGASGFNYFTTLYTNNGDGSFTEVTTAVFEDLGFGSIAFADINEDNNGDMDVVITGSGPSSSFNPVTRLYTNDGNGTFVEVAAPFTNVQNSSILFADMDGENGPDLVLSGQNTSGLGITELYLNDGSGNFSIATATPFDGVRNSAIAVGDMDGDGSLDLLVTGTDDADAPVTKLYTNDGTIGNPTFTEVMSTPFETVDSSAVAIADIDGVNGNDIIISGGNSSGEYSTKLYINNGTGDFTEVLDIPFEGVYQGDISISDVDGDALLDVLITGRNSSGVNVSILYRNRTDFVPPTIISPTTVDVDENVTSSFYTAEADDTEVTFSLGTSKDEVYFQLNGDALSFINAPDFETPLDADGDNSYQIDLIVTDLANNVVSQEVTVIVNNIDDTAPTITSPATETVEENVTGPVYNATANEAVTFSLGDSKDETLFSISTDAISFNNPPDFETALDADEDNTYELDLIAVDGSGNTSTKAISILVTNIDESGPTITSPVTETVPENFTGIAYTATADVTATFSLGSGKDESLFTLSTDEISFNSPPDFETALDADEDNTYELDLIATDSEGFSSTKAISIIVTDVAETGPAITSPATATTEENVTGTVYTATSDETVTFSLGSTKDEALFTLATDAISFNNPPDFEAPLDADSDNVYELDLIATDGDGLTTTKAISIIVTDVAETGPAITSPATATTEENVTGTVYTATSDEAVTFSLGSSKDEALFTLATDAISFNNPPDFEAPLDADSDNVYELDLIATDGDGLTTTKAISITVTNVEEAGPAITSPATATTEENVTGTVYTATSDEAVTFSLGSSKDEALFTLATDAISFNNPPDFETPLDADSDNVYELDLIATDGDGLTTTKAISITVTNVEEVGPAITSAPTATVDENVTGTVYTATSDEAVTFSLGSSKDEALFTLATDAISFNNPPDFETPLDSNSDNVYELDLIATDGDGLATTKAISITVTDVDEQPLATVDEILAKMYPNPVQHTLFIQPLNVARGTSIYVSDFAGRRIKTITYNGKEQEIDVTDLTVGVYLLTINSNGKYLQVKFVKE